MTTTARRKSMKEDQLVTTTFRVTEWAQEHFNQVIIGVVVLVALVAVLVFASNSRENSAKQAEREIGAALMLYQQGDFTAANASFQQIVQRHKGRHGAAARFFKAECDLRLGNYREASEGYDEYLSRRADYPMFESAALIGKALSYEGAQNYPEAARVMAEAVETLDAKDPRYVDAAFTAGEFYERAGNAKDALKYYERVVAEGSGDMKERAAVAVAMLK